VTGSLSTSIRDGSRDGGIGCLVCGASLPSSRARYCSRAHQQHAFRLRHRTSLPDLQRLRQELQRRRAVAAQTVYECSNCGERRVGERRCPDCQLFSRAIGLGGHCPECDTPLLLVDLLGEEVVATH
jgi:ribosomal protein L32